MAIGTKIGPSFAYLFDGYLFGGKILSQYIGPVPDLYKRYIDDAFVESFDEENDLLFFIKFVSSYHPAIKYTFNITQESLSFLDINCKAQCDAMKSFCQERLSEQSSDSSDYVSFESSDI